MIKSMTGYGKGQATLDGMTLTVEIKSVNHRYADIGVKCPRAFLPLEAEMKKRVGARLKRGKIDVFINQEYVEGAAPALSMNRSYAEAYLKVFREMQESFSLSGDIPLSLLVAQKDVISVQDEAVDLDQVKTCLEEALGKALEAIEKMRLAEGEATAEFIRSKLDGVQRQVAEIEDRAPCVPLEWRKKLEERLEKLNGDVAADPQRVAQEVAFFADRCDISEEIARFGSHLGQFNNLFAADEPVGRQMDFLVQELNRETNTMGSKANDADLTRLVVSIKSELEKIREQVQNIE